MPTYRERLRTEAIARLTGLPHVASEPTTSRSRVKPEADVPVAVVWIESDTANGGTADSTTHELAIEIELIAKPVGASDALTVVEAMSAEVEARLSVPLELVCLNWESTSFSEENEGKQPFTTASLRYTAQYSTPIGLSVSDPAGG